MAHQYVDYYDIMVIGKAGRGKSTTTDKLLILDTPLIRIPGQQPQSQDEQLPAYKDEEYLSMWVICGQNEEMEVSKSDEEQVQHRLKNIAFCKSLTDPHVELQRIRSRMNEEGQLYGPTQHFELLSNNRSKLRVLDLPGFFGKDSSNAHVPAYKRGQVSNLVVVRKIVRIQTAMSMHFRRILYFLPEQGPLNRTHTSLEQELENMAYYFGRSIFECMVIVATLPKHLSGLAPDDVLFPEELLVQSKKHFQEALTNVLLQKEGAQSTSMKALPDIPIIFISAGASCESIIDKIKAAPVIREGLQLMFSSDTCARCSMKFGSVGNDKVACYYGKPDLDAVPYDESKCHPTFIPRYSRLQKFIAGIGLIVSFRWRTEEWLSFADEVCAACKNDPSCEGCMVVGSEYRFKGKNLTVNHSSTVENPQDPQNVQDPAPQSAKEKPMELSIYCSVADGN